MEEEETQNLVNVSNIQKFLFETHKSLLILKKLQLVSMTTQCEKYPPCPHLVKNAPALSPQTMTNLVPPSLSFND